MNFSQKIRWPIAIIWPADTPVETLPDNHMSLPDGRYQAIYANVNELRESIHALALIKAAATFASGGQVTRSMSPQPGQLELFSSVKSENYYRQG